MPVHVWECSFLRPLLASFSGSRQDWRTGYGTQAPARPCQRNSKIRSRGHRRVSPPRIAAAYCRRVLPFAALRAENGRPSAEELAARLAHRAGAASSRACTPGALPTAAELLRRAPSESDVRSGWQSHRRQDSLKKSGSGASWGNLMGTGAAAEAAPSDDESYPELEYRIPSGIPWPQNVKVVLYTTQYAIKDMKQRREDKVIRSAAQYLVHSGARACVRASLRAADSRDAGACTCV